MRLPQGTLQLLDAFGRPARLRYSSNRTRGLFQTRPSNGKNSAGQISCSWQVSETLPDFRPFTAMANFSSADRETSVVFPSRILAEGLNHLV
jgi:hypothetical protein